ncbi:FAD-dependent oxidoreductase [Marinicellulosiphila megalodicopiae]|uniref:FAD-dependent oxidoreductase n=1 Tax=Marinicellulosiphila megalodicopiae TaxID=2724896 RepID=UPI003BB10A2E
MIESMKQVAIVGAGLVGRMLVWRLLNEYPDLNIHLFDKDDLSQSTSAAQTAAGMISPLSELCVSDRAIYDMGLAALTQWPNWLKKLEQQTGRKVDYQSCGSIVLAHALDQNELTQFQQEIDFKLTQHDLNKQPYKWLDKTLLLEKESMIGQNFESGLFLNDEAYIDNRELLTSLKTFILNNHITVIDNCQCDIVDNVVEFDDKKLKFDFVFDCRGIGSNVENLRSVRGEVMHVECKEVNIKHAIRFMHPRYKLYIVPKPNHRYVIGATEIESHDNSPMSLQSMMELGSALYSVHPAFAESRVLEIDANLRPAMLDNNPVIKISNNVMCVNGLYRHGYLLIPEVINTVMNILKKQSHQYHWMVSYE